MSEIKKSVSAPISKNKKMAILLKGFFLSQYNYSLTQNQCYDIIIGLLGKTKKELDVIAQNKNLPFWIAMIAKKAAVDYEKGSIDLIEKLFDRAFGKPKQTTVVEGGGMAHDFVHINIDGEKISLEIKKNEPVDVEVEEIKEDEPKL